MQKLKILNAYAGIGGNRKLWGNTHEITAIEYNEEIASIYQENFTNDKVIVTDAHNYILENFQEFDFIWSSPPCPSHSKINTDGQQKPKFPDMTLYQQIILLSNNWYKGHFCIENVIPYYTPLINPSVELSRHYFWTNFKVLHKNFKKEKPIAKQLSNSDRFGFTLKGKKLKHRKVQILRNLVDPKVGEYILNQALKDIKFNKGFFK